MHGASCQTEADFHGVIASGVVEGERGERRSPGPNIFCGNAVPPNDIRTRRNGDTVALHQVGLAKKCKVYGKLILRKIIEIVATRCHIIKAKMYQIRFRLGLRWGNLQRYLTP